MSNNKKFWNTEYQNPQLISRGTEPQADALRFIEWLQRDEIQDIHGKVVLDLGCGTGRNILYMAEKFGCAGFGYDFAQSAITLAENDRDARQITSTQVQFAERSIGAEFPITDDSIDIILDVTSSNSLSATERNVYLQEAYRTLKPGGYMFVRTLSRDGDRNAQNLLSMFPGPDYDTYIHPDLGITERVFREEDFRELYGLYFDITFLKKQTGYQRRGSQSYKRRYLVAYMKKKS